MITLSVIIPLFNEEKTICEILNRVLSVKLPSNIKKEITVVDDGSTDGSRFKVESSKFIKKIKLISHIRNLGKGAAIRTGLNNSSGDMVIIQDADLEYDPKYYGELLKPILTGNAKVVYGTRLKNYPLNLWGERKTVLPTHLIANKFLTALTNFLYNGRLTDMETCYKLFNKEVLNKLDLKSERFDFEAEITAKILKNGIPITEIPISVKPRNYKEGKKIGWIDGLIAIWTLIKYKFTN